MRVRLSVWISKAAGRASIPTHSSSDRRVKGAVIGISEVKVLSVGAKCEEVDMEVVVTVRGIVRRNEVEARRQSGIGERRSTRNRVDEESQNFGDHRANEVAILAVDRGAVFAQGMADVVN
jgi:hypothetical protein